MEIRYLFFKKDLCGSERKEDEKHAAKLSNILEYKNLKIMILQGDILNEQTTAISIKLFLILIFTIHILFKKSMHVKIRMQVK